MNSVLYIHYKCLDTIFLYITYLTTVRLPLHPCSLQYISQSVNLRNLTFDDPDVKQIHCPGVMGSYHRVKGLSLVPRLRRAYSVYSLHSQINASVIVQVTVNEVNVSQPPFYHSDLQMQMKEQMEEPMEEWQVIDTVVALFDYSSTGHGQLSFRKKDRMELINKE